MAERDRSADGLANKIEDMLLSGLRPFWAFVNQTPFLARFLNGFVIDRAVRKLPARPLALGTVADYTSWTSLNDRTWFARYRPPASPEHLAQLPPLEQMAELYVTRPGGPRLSPRSSFLFPAFAQWFTDGFLMTDEDRRRTRTNHQIDLCQLYGLNSAMTGALRLNDSTAGRRGRLRTIETATGEWAPPLYDENGNRIPGAEALPDPVHLNPAWPLAKKRTLFAFGGERANSNCYTAAVNTLFLREHNRLSAILEAENPTWDDDHVFEVARNINIVQLIRIVVKEYINHISPYWLQLDADPKPSYAAIWNRPNWIPVEFNLLYRWHSLVPEQVQWSGAPTPIMDCQFDNTRPMTEGLEAAFVSASETQSWALGLFNTAHMLRDTELRSIQQGRTNRLASYNDYRESAHYPRITRFEQITGDPEVVDALRRIYDGQVDRIEFIVGLFAEELPPRSAVPPLVGRMVAADAFSHALTNPLLAPAVYHAGTFTQTGLDILEATNSLVDLVRRNTPWSGQGRVSMEWPGYSSSA